MPKLPKIKVFCQFYKKIERSDSKILGILDNLDHFRHSFNKDDK
jgi:hypothetical protein